MIFYILHICNKIKYKYAYFVWAFITVAVCNSLFTSTKDYVFLNYFFFYLYRLLFVLISILFPVYLIKQSKIYLYYDKYIILIILYIVSALVSILFNFSTSSGIHTFILMLYPSIITLLLIQTADNKFIENIFISFVIFGLFNSILSIGSFIISGFSLHDDHSVIFADQNLYARFLCIIFAFAAVRYFSEFERFKIWRWELLVVILVPIQLIYLISRSGYILFIVAIFVILLNLKSVRLKQIFIVTTVLLLGVFSVMVAKRIANQKMAVADYSDLHRINLLHAGIKMIAAHPVIGVGYGQAQVKYKQFMVKGLPGLEGVTAIHNCYVNVCAEQGFIGLIIFLLLNGGLLYKQYKIIWKERKPESNTNLICFISLLMFMLQGIVYHSFDYEGVYWIIVAVNILSIRNSKNGLIVK